MNKLILAFTTGFFFGIFIAAAWNTDAYTAAVGVLGIFVNVLVFAAHPEEFKS